MSNNPRIICTCGSVIELREDNVEPGDDTRHTRYKGHCVVCHKDYTLLEYEECT